MPDMTESPPPPRHDAYDDATIRTILKATKTIAMVGATSNTARPSFIVFKYLKERGYDVVPVNPRLAGQEIQGVPAVARLADIGRPMDMVEVFRNSADAGGVVDEALALDPLPKVIWMQLSVRDDVAAARAEAKGVIVIMDRCPKIEFGRLSGEIGWQGINSRVLSTKRPALARGFQKFSLDRKL
jgi:predicted CoA-binding protein